MSPHTLAEMAVTLFEESGDALFLFDPDSEELLDINPTAQRLTGFTRPQLLRMPVDYLFRAEQQGGLHQLRQAYRKTTAFHSRDGFLLRCNRDGVWVPVNLTVTRLHAEPGTRGLITARDMTEHREAQTRLRQKEAELREVLSSVTDCLWSADVGEDGAARVRYCSPVAERLTGRPVELFLGGLSGWVEVTAPEDRAPLRQALADLQSGQAERREVEHRLLIDGEERWVRSNLLAHRQGRRLRLTGVVSDITEAVHRREQLRRSEARCRSLLENLEQNIFLKDDQLRFVAANRRFCEGLGHSEADLLGKTDFDFYPAELAAKYRADDARVLFEGARLEVEEENLLDGRLRWVRVIKTPVRDASGRAVGVLGIFWDVTEQRAMQDHLRQAAKLEAVGQMAGGVAHDFNNLLTAILGNLAAVRQHVEEAPAAGGALAALDVAEGATRRAAELTRQLLGFSGSSGHRPEAVDINRALGEVQALVGPTIGSHVELRVGRLDGVWPVLADPGQLCQVLVNLALNARDAVQAALDGDRAPTGGGWVRLEAANVTVSPADVAERAQARPGAHVRLRVADNGGGIPPDVLPRIFEPFFTTKGPQRGTGLGLAMVLSIVQHHGGWVECHSHVGAGTTFDVYLPRGASAAPAAVAPTASLANGRETILLVDDEPMLLTLGQAVLKRHGYDVLLANDGREAVERYRATERPIDLVILDRTMPNLTGREALRELRRFDPNVAVLFASGYAADQLSDEERGYIRGFLSKPYSPQDLVAAVRASLAPRESLREDGDAVMQLPAGE